MSAAVSALDALDAALQAERRALVENDAEALVRANDAKLAALRVVEANPPGDTLRERLTELAELNRANGALLTRRHREVRWALRHLGRVESTQAYGANGHLAMRVNGRALGVG
jgi:flagellar biosynthesis/type III secretory pathway chaperone